MRQFAVSQRRACELASIARSTFRYRADAQKDEQLREQLIQLAHEKPRYGYRRLTILLRWRGQPINHKRVFRIYRRCRLERQTEKAETPDAGRTTPVCGELSKSAMGD
jgi:putative transposase